MCSCGGNGKRHGRVSGSSSSVGSSHVSHILGCAIVGIEKVVYGLLPCHVRTGSASGS